MSLDLGRTPHLLADWVSSAEEVSPLAAALLFARLMRVTDVTLWLIKM